MWIESSSDWVKFAIKWYLYIYTLWTSALLQHFISHLRSTKKIWLSVSGCNLFQSWLEWMAKCMLHRGILPITHHTKYLGENSHSHAVCACRIRSFSTPSKIHIEYNDLIDNAIVLESLMNFTQWLFFIHMYLWSLEFAYFN